MTTTPLTSPSAGEALNERLFAAMLSGLELLSVELGRRLGLYRTLADGGPASVDEFARRAGIAERYAREWLEQQAAAGFLAVIEAGDAAHRRYALPDEHRGVFVDETDPMHFTGGAMMLTGVALTLPAVAAAFRTGEGVEYADFGAEVRGGIATLNRPAFHHDLRGWVDTMPDIAARLDAGGAVLDAGCGVGWSSIALARAFPEARIVGVDLDAASIAEARRNAEAEGVAERIRFVEGNGSDGTALRSHAEGGYALVTVFEALHDMGDPVGALSAFREVLEPGGAVLVADEGVDEEFAAPASEVDRLNYAFSALHCLPATMAEASHTANGTVLRPDTVRRWAADAGFGSAATLPVENPLWHFYRLG